MGNVEKLLDQVPSLCARGTAYPSGLLYPLLPLTLFPVPLTFKFCPRLLPCYQVELDFQYPSEGIHKRWDAGYRITCCGATRDQVRWLKLLARACSEWQDGDEWQGRAGGSWMGWAQATALSAAGRHGTNCVACKQVLQGQLWLQAATFPAFCWMSAQACHTSSLQGTFILFRFPAGARG